MRIPDSEYQADLFVASCCVFPEADNLKSAELLAAGDYQVTWAHPNKSAQGSATTFSYAQPWTFVLHSKRSPQDLLPSGDVMIYVHGFNDPQLDAMQRSGRLQRTGGVTVALGRRRTRVKPSSALKAAQVLHHHLAHPTPHPAVGETAVPLFQHVIAFTWPTAHSNWPGYLLDKEVVSRFAAFSLSNLLVDLRVTERKRKIFLVAHSMGCFLAIKALSMLAAQRRAVPRGVRLVDQMIFYAADLNADALEQGQPIERSGYGFQALDLVGRLVNYASSHDNVLMWEPFVNFLSEESGGKAGGTRLGYCGPFNINATHENVLAINCSNVVFDHGDYFVLQEVIKDTADKLAEAVPDPPLTAEARPLSGKGTRWRSFLTLVDSILEWWEGTFLCSGLRWRRIVGYLLMLPATLVVTLLGASGLGIMFVWNTLKGGRLGSP